MIKIVGILNIAPDSFSDGGKYCESEFALKQAQKLIDDGADIIDVGAESTRPGSIPIDAKTELSRLSPMLQDLVSMAHNKNVLVSIDTYKPEIAEFALSCGVDFINDVHGFTNEGMVRIAVQSKKKIIVTHNLWVLEKKETHCLREIVKWCKITTDKLQEQGIEKKNIIIDPGIGFGKTSEESWEIVNNVEKFHALGTEIYVGHSRKRFVNLDNDDNPSSIGRDAYTLGVSTMLLLKKIHYIRVHNVALHKKLFNKLVLL